MAVHDVSFTIQGGEAELDKLVNTLSSLKGQASGCSDMAADTAGEASPKDRGYERAE